MHDLTFAQLRETNVTRCKRWHPDGPENTWTIADWSNAVAGEMGELANVVKKIRRADDGIAGVDDPPRDELLAMAADECADVATYLDLLAHELGIDLAAAVAAKFNRVSERQGFPERLSPVPVPHIAGCEGPPDHEGHCYKLTDERRSLALGYAADA